MEDWRLSDLRFLLNYVNSLTSYISFMKYKIKYTTLALNNINFTINSYCGVECTSNAEESEYNSY